MVALSARTWHLEMSIELAAPRVYLLLLIGTSDMTFQRSEKTAIDAETLIIEHRLILPISHVVENELRFKRLQQRKYNCYP